MLVFIVERVQDSCPACGVDSLGAKKRAEFERIHGRALLESECCLIAAAPGEFEFGRGVCVGDDPSPRVGNRRCAGVKIIESGHCFRDRVIGWRLERLIREHARGRTVIGRAPPRCGEYSRGEFLQSGVVAHAGAHADHGTEERGVVVIAGEVIEAITLIGWLRGEHRLAVGSLVGTDGRFHRDDEPPLGRDARAGIFDCIHWLDGARVPAEFPAASGGLTVTSFDGEVTLKFVKHSLARVDMKVMRIGVVPGFVGPIVGNTYDKAAAGRECAGAAFEHRLGIDYVFECFEAGDEIDRLGRDGVERHRVGFAKAYSC